MAENVIGLEVAEESVRAVEVTGGRKPRLLAAGEVPLPPGAAKDSEVLDPDAVALALRHLWSQAGLRGRKVHLGVANRRILVREYVSPKLAPALLKAALPYEVQDLLPVPVDQAVLDFHPVAETDTQILGLLVAAVSENIEAMIQTIAKAKLRVEAVDFVPFGLVRAARAAGLLAEGVSVAIASVGQHTTSVVVVDDAQPRFIRIIPIDMIDLGADADAGLAAPLPEPGGGARRALGPLPTLQDDTDPALADLASRLRSTLDFYGGRQGAREVGALYVTGTAATMAGVGATLTSSLDLPVRYFGVEQVTPVTKALAARGTPPPSLMNALGTALGEER